MVPVSVRTEDQKGAMGNKVSAMIATLATDEADPVARLRTIHDAMQVAKEQTQGDPGRAPRGLRPVRHARAGRSAARAVARTKIADLVNVPFNVTISNIPGPNFPLYGAGARLVGEYPVSAIADGIGLNITVMSYMGDLDFGIVADREHDARRLAAHRRPPRRARRLDKAAERLTDASGHISASQSRVSRISRTRPRNAAA